jgi:hypothetical protein
MDEIIRPDVQMIGAAIMAEVPDDSDPGVGGGSSIGVKLDQSNFPDRARRDANARRRARQDAVARGKYAMFPQQAVITCRGGSMPGGLDRIETTPVKAPMRAALETAQEEAFKRHPDNPAGSHPREWQLRTGTS